MRAFPHLAVKFFALDDDFEAYLLGKPSELLGICVAVPSAVDVACAGNVSRRQVANGH